MPFEMWGELLGFPEDFATRDFLRIPTMPISRSCGSRSVIPIDPDHGGVGA